MMNYRHLTKEQDEAWHKLVRRLEQVGRDGTYSVITIRVLVNECGQPVLWHAPECSKIEPKQDGIGILDGLHDALLEFSQQS